jgi:serine/threonine protein kinase/Tol biopolymer transport system component
MRDSLRVAKALVEQGSAQMTPERWQEIKKVLAGALDQPPEERSVYLDQACTDPDLRREVESLIIAHDQRHTSFLEQPTLSSGPLHSGTKLGPYTILARIGSGGMGEVYRAHDTNLKRDVAIKVLPPAFVNDSERLTRFQREARMLASLNHPNIASIYGMEDSGGTRALVMELVEGPTLAERLSSGPLTCNEALTIGSQIAEALETAHEKGVIHRDLKPANVKLTPEGRVKVLDFGLAKAFTGDGGLDLSLAPTVTAVSTDAGRILGTPAYMSPEQARGKSVDKRTDVWTFGCVLYELLTARRAFPGETLPDTIAAVLEKEPEWLALPPAVPLRIRDLLRRCLQKDPQRRLRDLGDARIEIDEQLTALREQPGSTVLPNQDVSSRQVARTPVAPKRSASLPWTLLALLVAGFGAWIVFNGTGPSVENPLSNAVFTPLTDFTGAETNPAISPDGKFVAFISDRSGTFDVWVIQASGGSLANLTQGRIGDVRAPLRAIGFSSDGSEVWTGGTEGRRLMLWPLMGGAPHNFLDPHAAEVAWSPDGRRLVYHKWDPGDPVFVADYNGANSRQIVQNEPGLHNHYSTWSMDGRWIYLVRGRPATRELDLWRISPEGGEPEQLTHLNTDITYPTPLDDRTVLFVAPDKNGAGPWLWAFDLATRTSHRVSSGLEQYTALAATADRRRLAASVVNPQVDLRSVPITSRIVPEQDVKAFPLPTVRAQAPRFGGGSLFYLSSRSGADGLWSYRDGQALEVWKGSEGALHSPPAVSADGKSVAFSLTRNGKQQLHVMAADGTGLRPLSAEVDVRGTPSWSPDGKWIVVAGSDRAGEGLFKLSVAGGPPVRIATGPFLDPVWSPRGDLIVYCGTQVFSVTPLLAVHPDGTPAKLPEINVQRDGERARFLPDGTGLVYMVGSTLAEQDFWLLDLSTMRSRRLTRLSNSAVMRTFDITPDGKRIVFDRLRQNSGIVLIDLATKQVRPQ